MVDIIKKRVARFSLLLGGVSDLSDLNMVIDLTSTVDEEWRSAVVQQVQRQLKKEGSKLVAKRRGRAVLI